MQGVFLDNWKTARETINYFLLMRPLIKKIGLELIHNYRSISNLSFISNVVEKCALDQLKAHCDSNNCMLPYQSDYRKHFSAETAPLKICNNILWSMEEQQTSAFKAIDLFAAFDTADHTTLLDVLNITFGIEGKALERFDSYLRPKYCKSNEVSSCSDPRKLSYSVLHGSWLDWCCTQTMP